MDDSPWGDVPSQSAADSVSSPGKENDPTVASPPTKSSSTTTSSAARPSRKGPPRKIGAQPTKLESVGDDFDPLGPLSGGSEPITSPIPVDQAPTPPRKETNRPARPQGSEAIEGDALNLPVGRQRPIPQVAAQQPAAQTRQTQPSISVEQAAKPTFDILVGDPHKVGDLTSSHIVYSVSTKTSSKAYKQPSFTVSRRYRDFLWLYNSLHNNNPGVVVPPPPEKQAVGRFDTEFVESRRQALERMLNKIANHPILHHDADLKIFLESEAFNVDVKNREAREPDLGQSKGMLSSIGINVGSSSGKFNQLKGLMKALDTVVVQRKGLSEAAGDFAVSLGNLAQVELSPDFSGPLQGLSDVQVRIQQLYERQAQQDVLTLGITIDEYIRLVGSVKTAFQQRQKAFHSWHAAESELQKRRNAHDKLLRQGKSQQDKLNEVGAGVSDAEKKAHQARLLFEDMGRLMRGELERFEREKVEDFKSGVETFLEGAVEAQKELIELWETFLYMLDDTDEAAANNSLPTNNTNTDPVANNAAAADSTQANITPDQLDGSIPKDAGRDQSVASAPIAQAEPATATDVALEQDA
ncbi:Vacuolar protein sorting-associated protein vps5 [Cyphellophora attinorum]|uniref:Vacuolar protein sorting-associated protein vps5 n=1 Tax=Cyphellophora attinorum TaxID=1664694 RepID=A0A0N0NRJ8_9EURO|nr:Vacuolar protein sorting-associated protein vps5 [Phialophora attinorum]KPI45171.1 Vacuolar protein sorting-associated protein vps5 [Phialophora attinorum]